jgi:hypothetical protein
MSLYYFWTVLSLIVSGFLTLTYARTSEIEVYSKLKPQIIQLDLPAEDEGIGGLVAADVNDDSRKDFIITKPNHIAVYDNSGTKLWSEWVNIQATAQAEQHGLPGWHGPGVQAADVDDDGSTEVLYLTKNGALHIVEGSSGRTRAVCNCLYGFFQA